MSSRPDRLVAFALGLVLLLTGCDRPRSRPAVERVVLIGVDGLEWRVLRTLLDAGALPHLERFIAQGVTAKLDTLVPAYSPNIWTSVVTGKVPRKHGITGFVERTADGRRVPFTSNARRAAALWNIVGAAGLRVAVVGWWTTWPAEPVNGVLVSDRMMFNRFNLWLGHTGHGRDLPGQTQPPELADELADTLRTPAELEGEFFERFAAAGSERLEANLHDPWYELLLAYARDEAYRAMLERVLARESFQVVAYYVNGVDIASHYFWKYRYPEEWPEPIAADELARRRDVIGRYYAYVDESLAPLLERASERCLVIVMSDHGFVTGGRADSPNISGTHHREAPPGVLAMAGGRLPAGTELDRASVLDLAPTILHLLGLAVGRDMDGQVLPVMAARSGEVRFVDTYERAVPDRAREPIATEHDPAMLERLEALGYLDDAP